MTGPMWSGVPCRRRWPAPRPVWRGTHESHNHQRVWHYSTRFTAACAGAAPGKAQLSLTLIHAPSVDAPLWARENFRTAVTRGRMLPSVRPLVRQHAVAGLHGSSRTGSTSTPRAQGTLVQPGCPDPVSPTVAPCPPSVRPTPSRPCSAYAATAGARYTPPLTSKAQTMRAILLARATVTSIFGLRASMRASHEPCGAPR